jgi:hypothetical protein
VIFRPRKRATNALRGEPGPVVAGFMAWRRPPHASIARTGRLGLGPRLGRRVGPGRAGRRVRLGAGAGDAGAGAGPGRGRGGAGAGRGRGRLGLGRGWGGAERGRSGAGAGGRLGPEPGGGWGRSRGWNLTFPLWTWERGASGAPPRVRSPDRVQSGADSAGSTTAARDPNPMRVWPLINGAYVKSRAPDGRTWEPRGRSRWWGCLTLKLLDRRR